MPSAIYPNGRDIHGYAVCSGNFSITPPKAAYRVENISQCNYIARAKRVYRFIPALSVFKIFDNFKDFAFIHDVAARGRGKA